MKHRYILGACALALFAGRAAAQGAEPQTGWYGDLDLGRGHLTTKGTGLDSVFARQGITESSSIKRNDTAWGLNLGYRLNRNWGIEGGYENFGRFNYSAPATAPAADIISGRYRAHAWSLAGVGFLPLGNQWSLYGKAGLTRTSTTLSAASSTGGTAPAGGKSSRTGLLFGAGLNYDIDRAWYAKVGYDRYTRVGNDANTGSGSVGVFGAGIGLRF